MYQPSSEGIDHINAYSKSMTELGRLLSNFAHTPINLKNDGHFASIEAYWYWLINSTNPRRDELRPLYGFYAKKLGRELKIQDWCEEESFRKKIKTACWNKILNTPRLKQLLRDSTLPIVHYYSYGSPPKINIPENGKWIWSWYEEARVYLKSHLD